MLLHQPSLWLCPLRTCSSDTCWTCLRQQQGRCQVPGLHDGPPTSPLDLRECLLSLARLARLRVWAENSELVQRPFRLLGIRSRSSPHSIGPPHVTGQA